MALLTNPFFQIGAGLLARSGPSLQPINPYGGINDGLMAVQAARQDEQRAQYLQMQQEQMAREMERQQRLEQYAATTGNPLAMLNPQGYADAAIGQQFAPQRDQTAVSIKTAADLGLPGYPPETPVEVKTVNGQVVDYAPMTPPAAAADPRGQIGARYDEAVKNGYTGTLMDYEIAMKNAGASRISIGEGQKPMSIGDLGKLRMPDGSPPPPGMTLEQALASGATLVTAAEEGKEKLGAETSGYEETLRQTAVALKEANDRYKKDATPQNYARLKAAQGSYATALGQVRNPKGEPSGDVIRDASASVPLPFSGSGMLTGMTGGDSIEAGLREADSLYGLGLFKDEAPAPDEAPAGSGSVMDNLRRQYPGLR